MKTFKVIVFLIIFGFLTYIAYGFIQDIGAASYVNGVETAVKQPWYIHLVRIALYTAWSVLGIIGSIAICMENGFWPVMILQALESLILFLGFAFIGFGVGFIMKVRWWSIPLGVVVILFGLGSMWQYIKYTIANIIGLFRNYNN